MKRFHIKTLWFSLLLLVLPIFSYAHDARPLFVHIKEIEKNTYNMNWKIPPTVPAFNYPSVSFTEDVCTASPVMKLNAQEFAVKLYCENGIENKLLNLKYPLFNPALVSLIKIDSVSDGSATLVKPASEEEILIPGKKSFFSVFKEYLKLGISHILEGYDHLLFISLLVLIGFTGLKKIFFILTGFTVAHSITLALVALNIVRLPIVAIEAVIAFSIVVLALELIRNKRDSLTFKKPAMVSFIFGLLHGFGFANVLISIGLAKEDILSSLVAFNLGVEVGQVMYATAFFAVSHIVIKIMKKLLPAAKGVGSFLTYSRIVGYIVGFVAVYWFVERLLFSA